MDIIPTAATMPQDLGAPELLIVVGAGLLVLGLIFSGFFKIRRQPQDNNGGLDLLGSQDVHADPDYYRQIYRYSGSRASKGVATDGQ